MSRVHSAIATVDEAQLTALAAQLAPLLRGGGVICLTGELGAGKTTFARALLRALGVGERVKSPTYSLVESYRVGDLDLHHLDLYRIAHAGELEWLGLPDLATAAAVIVIEWPERGAGALPAPDLALELRHVGTCRELVLAGSSARGREWLRVWPGDASRSGLLSRINPE